MLPHQPPFQDVPQVIFPLSRAQLGPTKAILRPFWVKLDGKTNGKKNGTILKEKNCNPMNPMNPINLYLLIL